MQGKYFINRIEWEIFYNKKNNKVVPQIVHDQLVCKFIYIFLWAANEAEIWMCISNVILFYFLWQRNKTHVFLLLLIRFVIDWPHK